MVMWSIILFWLLGNSLLLNNIKNNFSTNVDWESNGNKKSVNGSRISLLPGISLARTGKPHAIASKRATGQLSFLLGKTKMSAIE